MPLRTRTTTAAPPVTATEVAVLGLLADGERSGYDLLRAAERSVGFFWTPAKTQLYAVLRKLVENGFATSRLVRQYERPDKTLYRLTDLGRSTVEDATVTLNNEVFSDIGMTDDESRALADSIETLRRHAGDF